MRPDSTQLQKRGWRARRLRWGGRAVAVLLILVAFWLSESARRSPYGLPRVTMPCVAGWWPWGNVVVEISDGAARAACLSVPKDAIVAQEQGRWVELNPARIDSDCSIDPTSLRIRVEQWQSAKAPQPSLTHPALGSDYPNYLMFDSSSGAGTQMFVPRDSSSGLRTITCAIGADKCWAAARDELMLVKWPTSRKKLASGLEQEWSCVREKLDEMKID